MASWLEEAGLSTWTDVVGNVRGRIGCSGDCADDCGGALVLGSHYDTVLDAGKYDGPLGLVAAIAAIKAFLQELGTAPRCPVSCASFACRRRARLTFAPLQLEVIAFSDEEGVRFHSTFLGSRVFSGTLSPSALLAADADGVTLEQARFVVRLRVIDTQR